MRPEGSATPTSIYDSGQPVKTAGAANYSAHQGGEGAKFSSAPRYSGNPLIQNTKVLACGLQRSTCKCARTVAVLTTIIAEGGAWYGPFDDDGRKFSRTRIRTREQSRLVARLEILALTDEITGLMNRRGFNRVTRIGGDEFAILLAKCSGEMGISRAEEIERVLN